jgi:hypothetical protein
MTAPVTVIASVVVVAYLSGVERVWPNATGAMSAPQARITIVFFIMFASSVDTYGYG